MTSFLPKAVTGLTLSLPLPADVPHVLPFGRKERVGGGEFLHRLMCPAGAEGQLEPQPEKRHPVHWRTSLEASVLGSLDTLRDSEPSAHFTDVDGN